MGNALRFLYANCCKPTTSDDPYAVSSSGVSALAHDLFHFENTSQVYLKNILNFVSHLKIAKNSLFFPTPQFCKMCFFFYVFRFLKD
jgi:hypothetical protein